MVRPATMPGSASGSSTFHTIWLVVAPIDWAASTRPLSTSRSAVSTSRAMKGAAASVSGTTAAAVPMDEPVINRVNGMMATSKMMNGVERTAFTSQPTVLLSGLFSSTPPRSVRRKNTPSGIPIRPPTTPEMPTITMVSHSEVANSSSIISEKFSNIAQPSVVTSSTTTPSPRNCAMAVCSRAPSPLAYTASEPKVWSWISSIWPCRMERSSPCSRIRRDKMG